ncbi:MAG: hypothetical protein RJA58_1501 [Pseudomonadota bacterium]|jgi:hypothetical protein
MVLQHESVFFRDLALAILDLAIHKLFDKAAVKTDQVVMMRAFIELKNRFPGFEITPLENAGLLELREHPIDGRQANFLGIRQQGAIDVLRSQVAAFRALEYLQHLDPGAGNL